MKNLFKMLAIMFLLQVSLAGSVNLLAQDKQKGKDDKVKTTKYWVSMTCDHCKAKVEKNIAFEKGVKALEVDLDAKTVKIDYRTDKTSPEKIEKAIQKLGFKTEKLDDK